MASSITQQTDPTQEHVPLDVEETVNLILTKGGRYSRSSVRDIVGRVNDWCSIYLISPRVVMAQILHETGWFKFTGDVQWWQFNFAGLGATGGVIGHILTVWETQPEWVKNLKPTSTASVVKDGYTRHVTDQMINWAHSINAGVLAVVQHHAVYLHGLVRNWPIEAQKYAIIDPRYTAVIDKGYHDSIMNVGQYAGKWAVDPLYAEKIIPIANSLPVQETSMPTVRPYVMSIPLRVSHAPWGNPNRPGVKSLPSGRGYITVHETGNISRGANAEMHRKFVHNGGGSGNVSFNYVVDNKEAIELIPRGEKTWQASDGANGPGNSSVSIETCVNADGDFSKTLANLTELLIFLVTNDANLSVDRIVQHNYWAPDGKNCPTIMRGNSGRGWQELLKAVREGYRKQMEPVTPPTPERDPNALQIDGFWIINEMLHRWEGLGENTLPLVGYPLSRMDTFVVDGIERQAQIFERGILAIYEEGTPDGVPKDHPFYVRMLTLKEQDDVVTQAIERGIIDAFE